MPLPFLQSRPEKNISGFQSKWNAGGGILPIIYRISNTKFPLNSEDAPLAITAITEGSGGFAVLEFGAPHSFVANQYVFVDGDTYNGVFRIISAFVPNQVTIDAGFVTPVGNLGSVVNYYNNYQIVTRIYAGIDGSHPLSAQKPIELISTINQPPDRNNEVSVDVTKYVKTTFDLTNRRENLTNPNDINLWSDFYIEFAEQYELVRDEIFISSFTSDSSNVLHAVNNVLQFKNMYGGNLFEYTTSDDANKLGTTSKFLTLFQELNFFQGIPYFDFSAIVDIDTFDLVIQEFDINYQLLDTQVKTYQNNGYGVYRLHFDDLTFDLSTEFLKVTLESGGEVLTEEKKINIDKSLCLDPLPPIIPLTHQSIWETSNISAGSSDADQVRLPISGATNLFVDWGDGSERELITDPNDAIHTYSVPGQYTIQFAGNITSWKFNNTGDRLKILDIQQWGDLDINSDGQFFGCANMNISATEAPTITTTTFFNLFHDCSSLNADLSNWDVSNVTNFQEAFRDCTSFNSPLNSWDMSQAVDLSGMFRGANSFNQDLNSWNTSKVSDFSQIFAFNSSFNGNIANWNTSSAKNFEAFFLFSTSFNQDISFKAGLGSGGGDAWNTGNVTNMRQMFFNTAAFNQDISGWNVSNVTDMTTMLRGCPSFNQPIGAWNTSSLISASNMLQLSTAFNQDLSNWDVSNVTNFANFLNSNSLSTANYDALLIGWEAQAVQPNVVFDGGNSKYTGGGAAETARDNLVGPPDNWIITDGGPV